DDEELEDKGTEYEGSECEELEDGDSKDQESKDKDSQDKDLQDQDSQELSNFILPTGLNLALSEALFQLSVMIWTYRDLAGDMISSVLIHFVAVLGIHCHFSSI
ncbi:hypothetical protein B0O99DRAFT_715429, partial [Bisporella sp. PMI_857]